MMTSQNIYDYNRIAKAIDYIGHNFKKQPTLNELAEVVHMSPFHFQRMFSEWAGVSPKKFIQYLSIGHAKTLLKKKRSTLFETTYETGLSSTSRLHNLFINIIGMTPGEYKNGGEALAINYNFYESPFGEIIIASTSKGICHLEFITDQESAFLTLAQKYPNATYATQNDELHNQAQRIFNTVEKPLEKMKLHLSGTPFQLQVWQALLKIPFGVLETYGGVAQLINNPGSSRAVGSAVGSNPVAFLIPCHRVIRSTGLVGEYKWDKTRKRILLGWEASKAQSA